ncbi:hypothetical protein H9P43_009203 [Blastocladiella emersonii ATCC 22665]|nr:hypothetical protein H9P43_009203 [Blastocladiella emersonii ATCC 22665]
MTVYSANHTTDSTALVLGETQQGKTTLLNFLLDAAGASAGDFAKIGNGTSSCTKECTTYSCQPSNFSDDATADLLDEETVAFGEELEKFLQRRVPTLANKLTEMVGKFTRGSGRYQSVEDITRKLTENFFTTKHTLYKLAKLRTLACHRPQNLTIIESPGYNDSNGDVSPGIDLYHLAGVMKHVLDHGPLNAIIYVIKCTQPFNAPTKASIELCLDNLTQFCSRLIVVHSAYNPVEALQSGKDLGDISERIAAFEEVFKDKPYAQRLHVTHLPMANVIYKTSSSVVVDAFSYEQRETLLRQLADAAAHTTTMPKVVSLKKPNALNALDLKIGSLLETAVTESLATVDAAKDAKTAEVIINLTGQIARAGAKAKHLRADATALETDDEIKFSEQPFSFGGKFAPATFKHIAKFEDTKFTLVRLASTMANGYEFKSTIEGPRSGHIEFWSRFWAPLRGTALAYTVCREFYAAKIKKLRIEAAKADVDAENLVKVLRLLKAKYSQEEDAITLHERKSQLAQFALRFTTDHTMPFDLFLRLTHQLDAGTPYDKTPLARFAKSVVRDREAPADADAEEVLDAYLECAEQLMFADDSA